MKKFYNKRNTLDILELLIKQSKRYNFAAGMLKDLLAQSKQKK